MTESKHTPRLEDVRVKVARQALAELPDASDNEEPYFWIGRLRTALEQLLDVAAPAPAGLDAGQREVMGQAIADALARRTPDGHCFDCTDADEHGTCLDHAADLDLTDAYIGLANELGIRVEL